MMRSIKAVVSGLAALVLFGMAAAIVVAGLQMVAAPLWLGVPLAFLSLMAAFGGAGWVASRLAPTRPLLHAGVLALVALALGAITTARSAPEPQTNTWIVTVLLAVCVVVGGLANTWVKSRKGPAA
jgi:hypothetical protein